MTTSNSPFLFRSKLVKLFWMLLLIGSGVWAESLRAATFIVSSPSNAGPGSLRQAIIEANNSPGLDTISFSITGLPPFLIQVEGAFPAITDPVRIDGRTQLGFVSLPLIEVNGQGQGPIDGLAIKSGQSEIRGLAITGFGGYAIRLETGGGNVVQGNHLGTDIPGLLARANQDGGIFVFDSAGNTISGNLISGGNGTGIRLEGARSINNVVQGNRIGTDVTGLLDLGNAGNGIVISGAGQNLIGGTEAAARNVISGNEQNGIFILNGATGNSIQGNVIGADISGTRALPNSVNGIDISGASGNLVGGTQPGAGNVVSGNAGQGVLIVNGSTENRVEGNRIGTDLSGGAALPNGLSGVGILGSPGNTVGGSAPGARNILSGNHQSGVAILDAGATGNRVEGNFIGVNASGASALANDLSGVTILGVAGNVIGGTDPSSRNVISGNKLDGITISDATDGTTVIGNYVGVDVTGEQPLGNAFAGIALINAAGSQIGGLSSAARNVISGNGQSGIYINGSTASGNTIRGNYIGAAASGFIDVANAFTGVLIDNAPNNLVGGSVPEARNIISGNINNGVTIRGASATGNHVSGNYIGLNADGSDGLGNTWRGVGILGSANNVIGGLAPGEGNIISANWDGAIIITGAGADRNLIQGNFIGLLSNLATPLGNGTHGVQIDDHASFNITGGFEPGAGNTIANTISLQYDGVRVYFEAGPGNAVYGNSIYLNAGLGIDLGVDGVTQNDAKDGDGGGNLGQNFPVITQASAGPNGIAIKGFLDSSPSGTFMLQFYLNSRDYPGGYGQGEKYIGGTTVLTDAAGHVDFEVTIPGSRGASINVTATATDGAGNTSEFSLFQKIESRQPLIAWSKPVDIVYGTALSGNELNASASVPGTFTYTPAAGAILPAGNQQTLNVTFTPADTANSDAASASVFLNVKRAPLTIRADDKSKSVGAAVPVLTVSYQGFVNNNNESSLSSPAVAATSANASSAPGAYPITVNGASSPNYEITFVAGTLTVAGKAAPVITWNDPAEIVYGTALTASQLNATANVPGTFTYTPALGTVLLVGDQQRLDVLFTPSDTALYENGAASVRVSVKRAALSVTADGAAKIYGAALPNLTFSVTGFVSGETSAVISGSPVLSTAATMASPAGIYPITVSLGTLTAANYSFNLVDNTLTNKPALLTVRAESKSKVVGAPLPVLTAVFEGFVSGDTEASLSSPAVLGTTATALSLAGSYPITVGGAASANYTISFVPGTLTVSGRLVPVITWNTPAEITYGAALGAGQLNATASVPGTFTYTPADGTVLAAGSQTLAVTFTPTDAVNFENASASVLISVKKAALTITAEDKSVIAGSALPVLTAQYAGFVGNDTTASLTAPAVLATTATPSSPAGTYPITVSGAASPNYTITFVAGTLTVAGKVKPLITWAEPVEITYGTALGAGQLNATANVPGTFAYTPAAGTVLAAGSQTLAMTFTPTDGANFENASASVLISVKKAALTITAENKSMITGSALPVLTAQYAGFVGNDTSASLTTPAVLATTATPSSPAGTYPITVSGAASPNYTISFVAGNLTVTQGNRPPVLGNALPALTATQSIAFNFVFPANTFTDPDAGDVLTYTASQASGSSLPAWLSFNGPARQFSGTPGVADIGTYSLSVVASDPAGASVTAPLALTVKATNKPPTITSIADQTILDGASTAALAFTVGDDQTPVADLVVTVDSSDKTVVALTGILLGGAGSSRTVTVTPISGRTGRTTITLTVADGEGKTNRTSFILTVNEPAIAADIGNWIRQVWSDTLGRGPTGAEVRTFAAQLSAPANRTRAQVALSILGSAEYDTLTVRAAFTTYLNRQADAGAFTFFFNYLQTGNSDFNMISQFLSSAEYYNRFGSVNAANNLAFLNNVYQLLLHRPLDSGAAAFFSGALNAGTMTRGQFVTSLLNSTEGRQVFISDLFLAYLRRSADAGALNALANQLAAGLSPDQARAQFLGSAEYFAYAQSPVNSGNQPPTITTINNLTSDANVATSPLAFTIGDPDTALTLLTVYATSSNQGLVPYNNITLGGSGASRTITITPAANQSGKTTITITVGDHQATATTSFELTVRAPNQPPTISSLANQSGLPGQVIGPINFTVSDSDGDAALLTLTSEVGNADLLPGGSVVLGGSGVSRNVTLTPAAGKAGTSSIKITVNDGKATASSSFLLTITVPPPVISKQPVAVFVPLLAQTGFTVEATGSDLVYLWKKDDANAGTGASLNIPSVTAASAGYYWVEVSNAGGKAISDRVQLQIIPPPSITVNPLNVTATEGGSASFVSGANGTAPISLRWQKNGQDLTAANGITGINASTLTLAGVTAGQAGGYRLIASNIGGSATSTVATLTVRIPPTIARHPQSQNVDINGTATFTVETAGDGTFSYQWRKNGVNINGANAATLTLAPVKVSDGGSYTVAVSTSDGALNSDPAILTVNLPALAFSDDFAGRGSLSGNSGSGAGSNAAATLETGEPSHNGAGRSVWLKWTASASGVLAVDTLGSTFDTYLDIFTGSALANLNRVAGDDNTGGFYTSQTTLNVTSGTEYQIAVAGVRDASGPVSFSWAFTPTAVPAPTITRNPSNILIPITSLSPRTFGVGQLSVEASGSQLSFQWFKGAPPGGTAISGATSSSLSVNSPGTYYARVTNPGGSRNSAKAIVSAGVVVRSAGRIQKLDFNDSINTGGEAAIEKSLQAVLITDTTGSASSEGEPNHCGVVGGASQWFTYRAPADGLLTVNTDGSDFDTVLAVYTGNPSSFATLASITCDNNSGPDGKTSKLSLNVKAGTNYFIAADGVGGATGLLVVSYDLATAATISAIVDQTVNANQTLGPISFTISSTSVAATNLSVTAISSNPALIPGASIILGGSSSNRTVTITPAAGQAGEASITLTVTDGANATTRTFKVTVKSVSTPPTISAVADQAASSGIPLGPITFIVQDAQTSAGGLTVSAKSSNTTLIPDAGLLLSGTNANRSLAILSIAGQSGTATITLMVTDGDGLTASSAFTVQVAPFIGSPVVATQPHSITVAPGATATFVVEAAGGTPLSYQWFHNTFAIDGGTNRSLVLTNVTSNDTGVYSVTVSNAAGSDSSDNVTLSLEAVATLPPVFKGSLQADGFALQVENLPAGNFSLESSTDLVAWTRLALINGEFGFAFYTDANLAGQLKKFYRVVAVPQP